MNIALALVFFLISSDQEPPVNLDNTPGAISRCLSSVSRSMEISRRLNPFYLRGDFDGDRLIDYVVVVQQRKSGKSGFAFCFGGSGRQPYIVAAGNPIRLEGGIPADDLSSIDVWGVADSWSTKPKRDALYLAQAEAGSGLLIWNGKRMVWQQTSI